MKLFQLEDDTHGRVKLGLANDWGSVVCYISAGNICLPEPIVSSVFQLTLLDYNTLRSLFGPP